MNRSLFIFRRDLRLEDNSGLLHALDHSKQVVPCFIFTPEQIEKNPYRGDPALQFLIESLQDLEEQLRERASKLYLFYGEAEKIVEKCIETLSIDQVIANRDYTPYSKSRDQKIATLCERKKCPFLLFDDALLHPPEESVKADGTPYTVFTPYFRKISQKAVDAPIQNKKRNYFTGTIPFAKDQELYDKILPKRSSLLAAKGGRTAGLPLLKKSQTLKNYNEVRDFPEKQATTHLSAYLKYTLFSPREIYHSFAKSLGKEHALIRSLYWRDFFSIIAHFFPHVFEGSFHPKYDSLEWNSDKNAFKMWCEGKTGFPLVDAGMRELNETGFMHNRVRMVVASFLTKDLHINWRLGEKYFANKLIDYDPAINNGNWQWAASTGCDAQPYFRIFNPWRQQEKFDPDCRYIKRWIPELEKLPPKIIHSWHQERSVNNYPLPIVDHDKEAKIALQRYRKVRVTN